MVYRTPFNKNMRSERVRKTYPRSGKGLNNNNNTTNLFLVFVQTPPQLTWLINFWKTRNRWGELVPREQQSPIHLQKMCGKWSWVRKIDLYVGIVCPFESSQIAASSVHEKPG